MIGDEDYFEPACAIVPIEEVAISSRQGGPRGTMAGCEDFFRPLSIALQSFHMPPFGEVI